MAHKINEYHILFKAHNHPIIAEHQPSSTHVCIIFKVLKTISITHHMLCILLDTKMFYSNCRLND